MVEYFTYLTKVVTSELKQRVAFLKKPVLGIKIEGRATAIRWEKSAARKAAAGGKSQQKVVWR